MRLEITRQLRQLAMNRQSAAVLRARADRAGRNAQPQVAELLGALAQRRREAAESSARALAMLGVTVGGRR
ncbi:hypothetical protein FHU33_3591 [Blastococcus colisei]|uniref:Uncharacterized protein n=1 Tax=Blastococcus colisei TaxID=1564162 RepID=A0A543PJ55_9ACTN|nr:hypothetical protein [Blastococcus colisei]TQN44105.1 hypothetical protein FHU33_3591 [Blastococcus colisei]